MEKRKKRKRKYATSDDDEDEEYVAEDGTKKKRKRRKKKKKRKRGEEMLREFEKFSSGSGTDEHDGEPRHDEQHAQTERAIGRAHVYVHRHRQRLPGLHHCAGALPARIQVQADAPAGSHGAGTRPHLRFLHVVGLFARVWTQRRDGSPLGRPEDHRGDGADGEWRGNDATTGGYAAEELLELVQGGERVL